MRVVANAIPKSGTHLLDGLLMLLGFGLVDLGGARPHLVKSSYRFPLVKQRLKSILGLRKPEDVMGIGPHLVEGGRFPPARRLLRGRGEKVTVGVVSPPAYKPPLAHQAPLQGPRWRLRQRPLHLHT